MISILDEVLSGTPKYRITNSNGNIIADSITIEMITPILQAGTPINKALFELFETDYTNQINKKTELCNTYDVGTLTTEKRTLTDNFNSKEDWREESTTKVSNSTTGFVLLASRIYDDYNLVNFIDTNDSSFAIYGSYYLTFQRPHNWKLKKLCAKVRGEYSSGSYKALRIGTDASLTSGSYKIFSSDQQQTDQFDITFDNEQTEFYMRSYSGSSNYDMKAYELYSITYETECNIISYAYPFTLNAGTSIKFKTPTNLNENIPTILKIGTTEINLNMRKANTNYEIIYNDTSVNAGKTSSFPASIKVGSISSGAIIPQTSGYAHYIYFVSVKSGGTTYTITTSSGSSYTVSTVISCSVNQLTRVVTCTVGGSKASANYIEIAWN